MPGQSLRIFLGRLFITEQDADRVSQILAEHAIINTSDYIIEGTLKA